MNRRQFLLTALGGAAALALPFPLTARAETARRLVIGTRTIEVDGRAATVYALTGPDGRPGLAFDAGATFDVALDNTLAEPTMIHWHGLTPPWAADGVPDLPMPLQKPGETRAYGFPVGDGGTHWMHAHTLQEQNLLAAPLIVRRAAEKAADEQEVVVLLHDFSFKPATEILAGLKKTAGADAGAGGHGMAGHSMGGMDHGAMMGQGAGGSKMAGHDMSGMGMAGKGMAGHDMSGHAMGGQAMTNPTTAGSGHGGHGAGGGMAMDLNDIDYDAYLANERTLGDPEVTTVEAGGRVRIRIINGATSTAFTIDTGALEATAVAVDGQPIAPVAGRRFGMTMGQRLDLTLTIPKAGGAFPILALREGAAERTGVVLKTKGAAVTKIPAKGDKAGPVLDLAFEQRLTAVAPLADRRPDRSFVVDLTGTMAGYSWAMEGDKVLVRKGQRIEITMRNRSMMAHPMHLHGHHFQVVAIDGQRFGGAVRDTVLVPPMRSVTVAVDAENPGKWAFHCHHLYHMATGMMATFTYEDVG